MGHVPSRIKTAEPETEFDKSLEEELLNFIKKLAEILNNGLSFADNFYAETLTVADTGNADTEFSATHTMKKAPTGFKVTNIDKAGVVYNSGTTWTTTTIYLKCDTANCSIKLLVF